MATGFYLGRIASWFNGDSESQIFVKKEIRLDRRDKADANYPEEVLICRRKGIMEKNAW